MLIQISDTVGTGGSSITVTLAEYEQTVRAMYPAPGAETAEAVDALLAGGPDTLDAATYLGLDVQEGEPGDRDEVDGALWRRWLDAQLNPRTHRWLTDVSGGGGVQVTIEHATSDGVWPGAGARPARRARALVDQGHRLG